MPKRTSKQMQQDQFVLKRDIATAYAPELTTRAALNRLARWINACQPLKKALKRSGYKVQNRFFRKKDLRLIYRHLGTP